MSPAQVPQADPFADPEPSPSPRADTNDEKPSPKRPACRSNFIHLVSFLHILIVDLSFEPLGSRPMTSRQ